MILYLGILLLLSVIMAVLAAKTDIIRDHVYNQDQFSAAAEKANVKNPRAPFSLGKTQLAVWSIVIISSFLYALLKKSFAVPEISTVNLVLLGISGATAVAGKIIDDSQRNNDKLTQSTPSEGFFRDILSDHSGVNIHRLQSVVWTIIVCFIYLHFVLEQTSLPDEKVISSNLLILMGISSGAYIGLKTLENSDSGNSNSNSNGNSSSNGNAGAPA